MGNTNPNADRQTHLQALLTAACNEKSGLRKLNRRLTADERDQLSRLKIYIKELRQELARLQNC